MQIYKRYVLPSLVHCACSMRAVMRQRESVVPLASGRVLEVGIGSGLNLPYYDAGLVTKVWGLDPSPEMTERAKSRASSVNFEVEFLETPGEEIPLEAASVDTVLVTYTLCTILDVDRALLEMARVLKPDGKLLFCEHGAAPDARVQFWQDCLNPIWKRLGGGCNLNRGIPQLVERAGFKVQEMQATYIPGWRPASYNYWGTATLPTSV